MAVDLFLKIDGIDGESRDDKHKGELDIESFSWGLTQPSVAPGGLSTGKVSVQDFHFVAGTGIQSPPMLVACATGQHFKKAVLTARKAGSEQLEFLKVSLEDVVVSSYQIGGTEESDHPVDQFSLNFTKVVTSVAVQGADGSVRYVEGGYDLVSNRKI